MPALLCAADTDAHDQLHCLAACMPSERSLVHESGQVNWYYQLVVFTDAAAHAAARDESAWTLANALPRLQPTGQMVKPISPDARAACTCLSTRSNRNACIARSARSCAR